MGKFETVKPEGLVSQFDFSRPRRVKAPLIVTADDSTVLLLDRKGSLSENDRERFGRWEFPTPSFDDTRNPIRLKNGIYLYTRRLFAGEPHFPIANVESLGIAREHKDTISVPHTVDLCHYTSTMPELGPASTYPSRTGSTQVWLDYETAETTLAEEARLHRTGLAPITQEMFNTFLEKFTVIEVL